VSSEQGGSEHRLRRARREMKVKFDGVEHVVQVSVLLSLTYLSTSPQPCGEVRQASIAKPSTYTNDRTRHAW
jgi:hypothetical protein